MTGFDRLGELFPGPLESWLFKFHALETAYKLLEVTLSGTRHNFVGDNVMEKLLQSGVCRDQRRPAIPRRATHDICRNAFQGILKEAAIPHTCLWDPKISR